MPDAVTFPTGTLTVAEPLEVDGSVVTYGNITADTLDNTGSVTTPVGGVAIATITNPPAGKYRIQAAWRLSGTAETTPDNLVITAGGFSITYPVGGSNLVNVDIPQVTLNGAQSITAAARVTAVSGAVYTVTLLATRLA